MFETLYTNERHHTSYKLIEDKFKTIVALYDKDVVEGRLMKDKE